MSCGDEGHILLSDNVAELLRHLSGWRDKIQKIGSCQIKDGWINVWSLVDGPVGNGALPKKSRHRFDQRSAQDGMRFGGFGAAGCRGVGGGVLDGENKPVGTLSG
jgi:hypothetical protein